MISDNCWYSHRKVLCDYCGVKDTPVFGLIQHGWINPYLHKEIYQSKNLINFFCWNKELEEVSKNNGFKKIKAIGAPFIYLSEMVKKKNFNLPKGTLVFPSHSNFEDFQLVNHKCLIDEVEKKFEPPFKVNLYYTDYKKKIINIYNRKNWEVLCSGARNQNNFLNNLYQSIIESNNCVYTEISSSLFYAMFLNKNVQLIKKTNSEEDISLVDRDNQNTFEVSFIKDFPEILNGKMEKSLQKKIADKELGLDCVMQSNELKKILGLSDFLKTNLAIILSKYFDFRYNKALRTGKTEDLI